MPYVMYIMHMALLLSEPIRNTTCTHMTYATSIPYTTYIYIDYTHTNTYPLTYEYKYIHGDIANLTKQNTA